MRYVIDTKTQELTIEDEKEIQTLPLYSSQAFALLSQQWLKMGWHERYHFQHTWLGHPIIQLPDDILLFQEMIFHVKPDVIIELGVACGGLSLFFATLCRAMNQGRVIGVDLELRSFYLKPLYDHPLSSLITLIEGNSAHQDTFEKVSSLITPQEKVMVFLDSRHSKDHVAKELELYSTLVSFNSYLVVTDGIKEDLFDAPRGKPHWIWDNPVQATLEFLEKHPNFVIESPHTVLEGKKEVEISHCKHGWLKKTC